MKIPCLSLWQPWASAIFIPGLKPIETRHWPTRKLGLIAIHAAKSATREVRDLFADKTADHDDAGLFAKHGIKAWDDLPLGAILGTVEIVDCVATPCANPLGLGEKLRGEMLAKHFGPFCAPGMWPTVEKWGDFGAGRFGHCYAKITKFAEPIPYKGKQGFFTVDI